MLEGTLIERARILVSGAGGSAAANVVDSLRRARSTYRLFGVDASPINMHLSTCDVRAIVPRAADPTFVESLRSLVAEHRVDVILPQPDPDVMAIARCRDDLGSTTLLPPTPSLELMADKSAFADAMVRSGVAVPESHEIESLDHACAIVEDMLTRHERVWLRVRSGAGSRGALPVRRPDQALAWITYWQQERGVSADRFMASEMLPGREFAYQSVWHRGRLIAGQARERLEYLYGFLSPSGQSSTPAVARTVRDARVDDVAQAAILAVDESPQGVYCVDIKEAADGGPRVTEINAGRFFTTSNFFAHAGLNMPDMLVKCALGDDPEPRGSSPLPADLYWIRMVDMGYVLVDGDGLDRWPRARL